MAYQSRFIVSKVQPGLINPSETPTQQIGVLFKGARFPPRARLQRPLWGGVACSLGRTRSRRAHCSLHLNHVPPAVPSPRSDALTDQ